MNQSNGQTGIAGVVESASGEHNAPVSHRWDDSEHVRHIAQHGGNYNAAEILAALIRALESNGGKDRLIKIHYEIIREYRAKRRRALRWLVAERRRRREAEELARYRMLCANVSYRDAFEMAFKLDSALHEIKQLKAEREKR